MENIEKINYPAFFNYKEENTDNGYETIQDFYLSWTLRWADDKYKTQDSRLYEFGRRTIFLLIHGYNSENGYVLKDKIYDEFIVTKVKTKRQYKKIDLLAEIEVFDKSISKKYILNIENKWYSSIRQGQLENSKEYINDEYGGEGVEIINLVVFCDEEKIKSDNSIMTHCKANGYKCLTLGDIAEVNELAVKGKTGNFLFDEFWINF